MYMYIYIYIYIYVYICSELHQHVWVRLEALGSLLKLSTLGYMRLIVDIAFQQNTSNTQVTVASIFVVCQMSLGVISSSLIQTELIQGQVG